MEGQGGAWAERVMVAVIGTLDADYRNRPLEAFLATPWSDNTEPQ